MEAILKRKNADANPNNTLQITELNGICCGDVEKAIVCKYTVTIATGSLAAASKISIDGTEYGFGTSIDLTTDVGRTALKAAIKTALASAGYTTDGVDITASGSNVTITTNYSQATFNYLQSSTYAFSKVPFGCKVVGNFNAKVCTAEATISIASGYVVIVPTSSERMTNVLINDGSADRYDALPVAAAGSISGNVDSQNGAVYLSISGLSYTGTKTFTITVSQEGCDDVVLTRSIATS